MIEEFNQPIREKKIQDFLKHIMKRTVKSWLVDFW